MILYPAIDLKDGQCVRLLRGEMDVATVFEHSPAEQAKLFESQGFAWLHVVDLNGAFEGKAVNAEAVKAILAAVKMPVQLGGGIRDMAQLELWMEAGLSRAIIGTQALRDPEMVKEACRAFPGKIAIGIDAKRGKVAVDGWANVSTIKAADLAKKFEDAGVAALIYTDIHRDGAMQGPNIEETAALADAVHIPIILSGGVSSLEDVKTVKAAEPRGISGMIIGRAMYEGAIDPADALKAVA